VRARRHSLFSSKPLLVCFLLAALCFILCCPANSACADTERSGDRGLDGIDRMADENAESSGEDLLDGFDSSVPEDSSKDNLLDGFEDAGTLTVTSADDLSANPSASRKLPVGLNGSATLAASYNFAHKPPEADRTDWRGLSRLRTELMLELDVKPADSLRAFVSGKADHDFVYAINGRENYTDEVLDVNEDELELWEAYLQGSITNRFDVKVGRQIMVWGVSDNIRVVDVINPLDLREPGITDIEDLRLPLCMTRLDYYLGRFNVSGIAIHEVRFNKNPPYGSDFYPLKVSLPEDIPESSLDNTQLAFSLCAILSGWDVAFYWADVYSEDTYLAHENNGTSSALRQTHARVTMAGSAADIAFGNWLIKAEVAWFDRLKFTNSPEKTYSRLDLLAGVEYAGFTDTLVTLEIVNRHLLDYDKTLENEPDQYNQDQLQWVARLERDFMNENLTLTILVSVYGETGDDGAYQRFSAEYDIADSLKVTGGVVCYQSGDLSMFENVGDNDRFFLEFTYSF
jgi:hypothetical protein